MRLSPKGEEGNEKNYLSHIYSETVHLLKILITLSVINVKLKSCFLHLELNPSIRVQWIREN
jgi:hypothetical protein